MKKFLSLVLALVMAMSLVTVSAGAKDFTDSSDINYKEAVDVMSSLEIIDGYDGGAFQPQGTLTRGAAAKIIACMMLGKTTAEALGTQAAPFKDVPVGSTFAGYIAYCVEAGIIDGYADGTFRPSNKLTGFAFLKMLLTALGYDSSIEGFTGTNWTVNVARLAIENGLTDGNDEFVGTELATREEACLYAVNTLKATLVEYENKGSEISINGAVISTGASKATIITTKTLATQTISNAQTTDGYYSVEFAEKYQPKLVLTGESDDFSRPANVWTYEGKEVGTYTKAADLTYTEKVESGEIYADLGLTKTTTVSKYYNNGAKQAAKVLAKNDSDTKFGNNGVETTVYYNTTTGDVTICEVEYYVGDVAAKYAATSKKDAYITIAPRVSGGLSGNFTTEDFAVDDIVLYTYSQKTGVSGVKSVEVAETVTGTLTNYTADKSATVGGTTYKYSKNIANQATSTLMNKSVDVELVLDKYGYAIDITDNGVKNYAVVLDIMANAGDLNNETKAQLLLTDATETGTVTVDTANSDAVGTGADKLEPGDIVEYSINSKGKYALTELATVKTTTKTDTKLVTNGDGDLDSDFGTGAAIKANGKTIFLVKDSAGNYSAYTGIKNVPTIQTKGTNSGMNISSYAKSGAVAAAVVFVDASSYANASSKDTIFVLGDSGVKKTEDTEKGVYYTYDAIVNGEITTIDSAKQVTAYGLYDSVSYDAKGIATLGTALSTTGSGTVKEANGVIGLDSKYFNYTDSVKVFYINADEDILTYTVSGIATDTNDNVWYKLDNNEVSYIFVQEVPEAATEYTLTAVTNVKFYSDSTTTSEITKAEAGKTVYVKADSSYAISQGTLPLTDLTGGVYSFTMPARNLVVGDITVGEIVTLTFKCSAGKTVYVSVNGGANQLVDDSNNPTSGDIAKGSVVTVTVLTSSGESIAGVTATGNFVSGDATKGYTIIANATGDVEFTVA